MNRFTLIALSLALWAAPALGQDVIVTRISDELPLGGRAGEAYAVADPSNPDKVTVIWLASRNTGSISVETSEGEEGCGIGRSSDGGRTWSVIRAPYDTVSTPVSLSICGDPTGVVLPDGSIVFTAVQLGSNDWLQSITSFDQGQTWTAPSVPFGANQALASVLATQSIPDLGAGRQWSTADPITREIFIQSQVDAPTTGRQMVVSTNRGLTWTVPRNTGSTSFGPIGAAYGIVAGSYTSGTSRFFQTSTDHGRNWTRNVMPVPGGGGLFGGANTAADPTKKGRFAVLISTSDSLEVWITSDAGRTPGNWRQAGVFTPETGDDIAHSWIAFGRNGALGVRWRSVNSNGSFDIDAVVSRDGGATWGDVVRLTADRGPAPAPSGSVGLTGDDCACNIHLTDTRLLTTWGDHTTGNREMWFGSYDYTAP